jgi:hypothetical protein
MRLAKLANRSAMNDQMADLQRQPANHAHVRICGNLRESAETYMKVALMFAAPGFATIAAAGPPQLAGRQTQADDYTRYELLAPDSAQFRIVYEVTATTPGATLFFNAIRKGSEASEEAVYDRMTGERLKFEVVSGSDARAAGFAGADPDTNYIKVFLPRAVPAGGGEVRLRIDKTYKDAKSYYRDADGIVFSRPLGIRRNAVVLPAGYELVACNFPSQVITGSDRRTSVSFINAGPGEVPLVVNARPLPKGAAPPDIVPPATPAAARRTSPTQVAVQPTPAPTEAERLSERAHQDREIVYFLQQPETHAFSLYHDYTESRPGTDRYLNVVRQGSTVSNPAARLLDTGETLKVETLKGEAITRAKLDIGEPIRRDSEVVLVRFSPVKPGQSVRLRIEETYTDPARYFVANSELVWDRSLGRPYNAVVLPAGWYLTASSIPAVVTRTDQGRTRLDYVNARPDEVNVLLKAARRAGGQ